MGDGSSATELSVEVAPGAVEGFGFSDIAKNGLNVVLARFGDGLSFGSRITKVG